MTPFNNELQVGQPAMIINVEMEKNRGEIGTIVTIEELLTLEESINRICGGEEHVKEPYAFIIDSKGQPTAILQRYLMPLPPLGDVYDDEMIDELKNLRVTCP